MPRSSRSLQSVAHIDDLDDAEIEALDRSLSLEDWEKLKVATLKSKCLTYGVVTIGRKQELVNRLWQHFHVNDAMATGGSVASVNCEASNQSTSEHATGTSQETHPIQVSVIDAEREETVTGLAALTSMVSSIKKSQEGVMSSLQYQQKQLERHQEQYDLLLSQQHLGRQQSLLQQQSQASPQVQQEPQSQLRQVQAQPTVNNHSTSHSVGSQGFQLPFFMQQHSTSPATSILTSYASDAMVSSTQSTQPPGNANCNDSINPFVPPPIKMSILKKIEKMEFVEFEELISNRPSASKGRQDKELCLVMDDECVNDQGNALRLRTKSNSGVIVTFANWVSAWNRFMEATLSYKPNLFHDLFSYQKIVTNIANKHRFDAVYMYDKEFRLQMASQASLKPEQRSVRWRVQNTELSNIHLPPSTLLSGCNLCKSIGHLAYSCPFKSNTIADGKIATAAQSTARFRNADYQSSPEGSCIPTTPSWSTSSKHQQHQQQQQQKFRQSYTCKRYNRGDACVKPPCKFLHVCDVCGQNHPARKCTTNSSFIPQYQK